jgi:glycine/D-amino acid oxidase-like deaminating enzyme
MHWNEGEPVAMLTGSRLTDKIDTTQYPAALFDNRGFVLDPMALARGLADKAEQEGVEIYEKTPALSIDPKRMRITTSGSVSAGAIIIATNPFTFHFDGIPGTVRRRVVPVYQYVSLMNTTRTPNERTPRSPVRGNYGFWDDQDIDYLFGRGIDYTHFMVSGGNFEFVAGHEPADPRTQDVANMNTLRRTLPGYEFITEKTWGGRIGATTDHVPAMGLIDKNIGVTALADGIPICYESGRTVARALLSKEPVPETFDINRRPRDVRGNLLRSIPVPGKLVDKAGKLLY